MEFFKLAYGRLKALVSRTAVERDIDAEMQLHLDLLADDYERSGMSRDEARRAARRRFGNLEHLKERARDVRGAGILEDLLRDLQYALRTLRRSPAFTAVVVVSLALGIGCNAALFSQFDAAFFRQLSVHDPERLVSFGWASRNWSPRDFTGSMNFDDGAGGTESRRSSTFFTQQTLEQFRKAETLSDVFSLTFGREMTVIIDGKAERVRVQAVSSEFYSGLGVRLPMGRPITANDSLAGADPVAVISDSFWGRQFGRDPNVLGRKIAINGVALSIVGVTPPGFKGNLRITGAAPEFSVPLELFSRVTGRSIRTETWWLQIVGRMRPGVTMDQVRGNLDGVFRAIASDVAAEAPQDAPRLEVFPAGRGFEQSGTRPDVRNTLAIIFGLLLVIVCLNIANLQLARSTARQYEMGVRLGLGASRRRLVRQLLTESLVLSFLGTLVGLLFTAWSRGLLRRLLVDDFDLIRIDGHVLAFAAVVSILTAILFGLAPALQATRVDARLNIKKNLRNLSGPRSRLGKSLLIVQMAASVVLLIGGGLLLRSVANVPHADVGFDTRDLLLFRARTRDFETQNRGVRYTAAQIPALYDELLAKIGAIPGVVAVTASSEPLVSERGSMYQIQFPDREQQPDSRFVRLISIRPNFFEVMGIPLVRGRALGAGDRAPEVGKAVAATAAVINETMARRYFPQQDPTGRYVRVSNFPGVFSGDVEIVGVVKDAIVGRVGESVPATLFVHSPTAEMLAVRTAGDPALLLPAIRDTVRQVDANLPLLDFKTQAEQVLEGFTTTNTVSLACTFFGGIALLLTCIGLYGLLSYSVARRTNEFGIRMALGARRREIVRLVMRQTAAIVLVGLAAGLAGSYAFNRAIRTLMFGVSPYDPVTIGAVVLLLLVVTALATYLPARRAARVDPTVALRYE
jgi:predicted permease